MTFRATESDLSAMEERLNRNLQSLKSNLRLSVTHSDGWINLMTEDHSEGFSFGNRKSELYWQLVLVNKVLESIQYEHKDNSED